MAPSSEGTIDISLSTRKIDVDNKISLRTYSRIADNLLRLADIFRLEDNTIDLYVMLLRFSSLATETIPSHRDYKTFPQGSKLYLKKKLITSLGELEELKPVVQAKIQALKTRKNFHQTSQQDSLQIRDKQYSFDWPANERHYNTDKKLLQFTGQDGYPRQNGVSVSEPTNRHFQLISQGLLRPKEETLSKHSILGPTGLSGQWKPPSTYKIQYPSNAQFTSLAVTWNNLTQQSTKEETTSRENVQSSEPEALELGSSAEMRYDKNLTAESDSLISFDVIESPPQPEVIRQPSPPPVLADVQELMAVSTVDTHPNPSLQNTSSDVLACCEDPLELHISTTLMDSFMRLAKSNTKRNLETCGVLAGSLKNRRFYITALIIPKQESTENSCQATNEEEIFEVQDKQSLFPLGWIHTHPTQSCFMSSIDVHTHYSYQIMLPEAIAIVMAPTDSSRTHGIFRLTSGGLSVIRQCPRRGFHSHDPPSDGMPIYSQCTDVYMNSSLQFDVIDLR